MLSSSSKNPLNKSVLFEINPKSVYPSNDENFDENYVSTSQKKLLPLAGISAKILENVFNGQEKRSSLKIGVNIISTMVSTSTKKL